MGNVENNSLYVFQDYYLENCGYLPVMVSVGEDSQCIGMNFKYGSGNGYGNCYGRGVGDGSGFFYGNGSGNIIGNGNDNGYSIVYRNGNGDGIGF